MKAKIVLVAVLSVLLLLMTASFIKLIVDTGAFDKNKEDPYIAVEEIEFDWETLVF